MIKTKVAFLERRLIQPINAFWQVFKKHWLDEKKLALQKATFAL